MNSSDLIQLKRLTYYDLVELSIEHLQKLRLEYRNMVLQDSTPPDFPTHIQVQTTTGCNASCIMCSMAYSPNYKKQHKGKISLNLFEKIVRECAGQESCKVISPYLQNEPLLDPELPLKISMIKELSAGRLMARIVTNGSLLNKKIADDLVKMGLDVISISLNAHSKDAYERIMPGLNFEETMRNIESFIDNYSDKVFLLLTFMVTPFNKNELNDAMDYWSRRGIMCGAYGIGTMGGTVHNFSELSDVAMSPAMIECFVPMETITILYNGDIILCCSDMEHNEKFGNVSKESLFNVWHSPALSHIRSNAISRIFDHKVCTKCHGQTKTLDNLLYYGGPGGT